MSHIFQGGKQRNMCHISSIIQYHLTPSSSNNLLKQGDPLIKEPFPSHGMIKNIECIPSQLGSHQSEMEYQLF